jgi:hypothetical protein
MHAGYRAFAATDKKMARQIARLAILIFNSPEGLHLSQ